MTHAKFQARSKRPWRLLLVGLAMTLWPVAETARAQVQPAASAVQPGEDGLTIRTAQGAVKVQVWGDNIVRVQRYRGAAPNRTSLAVVLPRPAQRFSVATTATGSRSPPPRSRSPSPATAARSRSATRPGPSTLRSS
jgi:alpha-D-xyloside xylohydrolase